MLLTGTAVQVKERPDVSVGTADDIQALEIFLGPYYVTPPSSWWMVSSAVSPVDTLHGRGKYVRLLGPYIGKASCVIGMTTAER